MAALLIFEACKTDFDNPNAIIEEQVLTTPEGLTGLTLGMTEHFATSSLQKIVEIPGLTTRELGNTSTLMTPVELILGGAELTDENVGILALWERLLRDKGVAEKILNHIDNVAFAEQEKKVGIKAYAQFMRAITIGNLAQNWEYIPLYNSADGNAAFVDQKTAYNESIQLLENAISGINGTAGAEDFINNLISEEFDFKSVLYTYLARYNIFSANYDEAINAANNVDLTTKSVWTYDGAISRNPIYDIVVNNNPDTKPIDDFGLNAKPDPSDGRISFYLIPLDETGTMETCSWPVEDISGFYTSESTPIPVYLPGEILLIKAEAYARKNDLANAVVYINQVRQKTDDIFGVNANLGLWMGNNNDQSEILDEIYKNRCIELFFQGLRLEDHRRFYPNYIPNTYTSPFDANCMVERNRNFYPYPYEEKINNKNCPSDPEI